MNNPWISVPIVIVGMISFMIVCNSRNDIPSWLLFLMLALVHIGLVWMVVTILRTPSPPGLNDRLYKDIKFKED